MAFYEVEQMTPHRDGSRIVVTWIDAAGSAAKLYHVWLDGTYAGQTFQRRFVFYGDGTHHVRIKGADAASETVDPNDPTLRPAVPRIRPLLYWNRPIGGGVPDTNIERFEIYQGNRSGGPVDETAVVMTIDVLADSDWYFVAIMDALKHGESRLYKVVPVTKDGSSDPSAVTTISRSINCHSPEMVVASKVYDSGTGFLTLTVAEITH